VKSQQDLRKYQLTCLQNLVGTIGRSNPFYRHKLNLPPGKTFESPEEFSSLVPFTTKEELVLDQKKFPPFGSNLTFPIETYTRFHQTSGTTTSPLRWLDTPESWDWLVSNWLQVFRAAGVTASDRILFCFSFGPFVGFWLAFEAAQKLGALTIPGGGMSSSARLKLLKETEATVICCTPTYALRLAEVARADGLDLSRMQLRKIMVAGEPGGSVPATRKRLEELWRTAEIFDHHGMTEVGPVSYQCPARPGVLHIIESSYFAEIINPQTNTSVAPGELGELILTPLGRTASPLLRYRSCDYVRAVDYGIKGKCSCETLNLGLAGGILGRVDDMVILRGVNVYPGAIEDFVRQHPAICEFQVIVDHSKALTGMQLLIEAPEGCEGIEISELLEMQIQAALNVKIPVIPKPVGSLPAGEMKSKRWVHIRE